MVTFEQQLSFAPNCSLHSLVLLFPVVLLAYGKALCQPHYTLSLILKKKKTKNPKGPHSTVKKTGAQGIFKVLSKLTQYI